MYILTKIVNSLKVKHFPICISLLMQVKLYLTVKLKYWEMNSVSRNKAIILLLKKTTTTTQCGKGIEICTLKGPMLFKLS